MSNLMSFFPEAYEAEEDWLPFVLDNHENDKRSEETKCPVLLMGSVKGGSSKTYNTLSLATALTNYYYAEGLNNKDEGAPVCIIDLDFSATNMALILSQLNEYLGITDPNTNRMNFDNTKVDIHRYIIRSAAQSIPLTRVTSTIEYEHNAYLNGRSGLHKIDIICGTQDSRIRRLFSDSRVDSYENIVREQEARILLMGLLDKVISKNYLAIIIDMQPGMEGLCHAAMEYFASPGSPEPVGNGPQNSKLKKLYERYEAHLCMCCTNDMTQMTSNLEWIQRHWELCRRLSHRHLIIKDNAQMLEKWLLGGSEESDGGQIAVTTAYGKWLEIKKLIKNKLKPYIAGKYELKDHFDSVMIATHNEAYLHVLCGKPVGIPEPTGVPYRYFDEIMVKSEAGTPEYDLWMRHALLGYEWKKKKDE